MLEFIIDIVVDVIIEGTFEGIMYLICKIIPEDKIHPRFEKALKVFIAILSLAITCMLFFGIVIRIFAESYDDKRIANTLLLVSGSIIAIFVIIRIFTPKKVNWKT